MRRCTPRVALPVRRSRCDSLRWSAPHKASGIEVGKAVCGRIERRCPKIAAVYGGERCRPDRREKTMRRCSPCIALSTWRSHPDSLRWNPPYKASGIEGGGRLRKNRAALSKNGRGPRRGNMQADRREKTMRRCTPCIALSTRRSLHGSLRWRLPYQAGRHRRGVPFAEKSSGVDQEPAAVRGGKTSGRTGGKKRCGVAAHALRYRCRDPGAARFAGAHPTKLVGIEEVGRLRKNRAALSKNGCGPRRGNMQADRREKTMRRCSPCIALSVWRSRCDSRRWIAPYKASRDRRGGPLAEKPRGVDQQRGRRAVGIHAGQIGGKNDAALQPMHCVISAAIAVRLASLKRSPPNRPGSKGREALCGKIEGR